MEKILKFVLLLLVCVNANAQSNFPKDGDNIRNSNLDKFIGTWVWKNGNDELVFILKKENVKILPTAKIYGDVLYGFHKFVKDGRELENSTQYRQAKYGDKKHTFFSLGGDKSSELSIGIVHLSKNKNVNGYIEYLDSNRIKLVKLENLQGLMLGNGKYDYGISLPQNIILTRQ
ncbi:hypothetical protein BPO_1124 [Bergeyella porcorum]|uniref:DUF6705 domain-containing protein n=1 Tax=Bergeyella porcorum TaxID=1735111 RepID=A0AAU0F347_9FLAO